MGKGFSARLTFVDVIAVVAVLLKTMGVNAYGAVLAEQVALRSEAIWRPQAAAPEMQKVLYFQGEMQTLCSRRCRTAGGLALV